MEIKFELKLEEVNVILAALGKVPFEVSAPVIDTIRKQAQPQLAQKDDEIKQLPKAE